MKLTDDEWYLLSGCEMCSQQENDYLWKQHCDIKFLYHMVLHLC